MKTKLMKRNVLPKQLYFWLNRILRLTFNKNSTRHYRSNIFRGYSYTDGKRLYRIYKYDGNIPYLNKIDGIPDLSKDYPYIMDISCHINDFDRWANSRVATVRLPQTKEEVLILKQFIQQLSR